MSRLRSFTELGNIKDLDQLVKFVSQAFLELQSIVNGKIEFDQNIKSQTVTKYFQAANTDVAIPHNLAKSNINYLVVNKTAAADVYNGSAKTTNNTVYLRSTVAGVTLTITLF